MSRIVMRNSDGEGQSSAIQHQSLYGFENFEVSNGQQRRKARRGQSQRNEDDLEKPKMTKAFMCMQPGCPRTFSSKFKLVRHLNIHSEVRPFQCTSCGRRFHRKDHLKNHLQVHNPNKILHSCDLCPKAYHSVLSYRKHIAFHAAESGDLVCKICGKMLEDREGIMHHLKVHAGSRTLRGPSERKFPCDRCDRSFFTKKDVKRHLVVHTGKRDFVCQFCPQKFGRKDHLVRHTKKSHVGNANSSSSSNEAMRKYEQPNNEAMIRKYEPPSSEVINRKFEPLGSEMMVRKFESSSGELMVRKFESPNGEIMVRKYEQQNGEIMVRKFEPPPSPHLPPPEIHKNNLVVPQPLPELSGIVISPTTVAPLMDHTVLEPVKPDPTYGVPPNLVQSNYSLSSLSNENGQNLGRFQESSLLPVSQYLPMSNSYPTVTPIMPHPYINMSTSSNILSDLLPPMSIAPSFTTLSLDATNPPLPHFSQAFQ